MKTDKHVIAWWYSKVPVAYPTIPGKEAEVTRTECKVFALDQKQEFQSIYSNKPVGHGTATQNYGDQYSKEKGRRVALAKAIEHFTKEDRTEIWEAYRTMTKTPRWNKKEQTITEG